jgi:PAS domain S-box-containing protein
MKIKTTLFSSYLLVAIFASIAGYVTGRMDIDATSAGFFLIGLVSNVVLILILVVVFVLIPVANRILKLKLAADRIGAGALDETFTVDLNDELGALTASLRDMTAELQLSQYKALEVQNNMNDIFQSMSDSLMVVSSDGTVRTVNDVALALFGLEQPYDRMIEQLPGEALAGIHSVLQGALPKYDQVYCVQTEGSQPLWLKMSVTPLRNYDGGAVIMHHDITVNTLLTEKLQKSFTLLDNLSTHVPGVIYQYQMFPDGRHCIPYASARIIEFLGVTPEMVLSDAATFFNIVHPEDRDALVASIKESARNLDPRLHEFRVVLPGTSVRWLQAESSMQQMEDGSLLWHGFLRDITKQKLAKEQLYLSRFFLGKVPVSIFLTDPDGQILQVNQAACSSLGYTQEELMSMTVLDMDQKFATRESFKKGVEYLKEFGELKAEGEQRAKDGRIIPVELTITYLKYEEKEYTFALAMDITERKRAEQKFRESEAAYRAVFETSLVGICMTDSVGRVLASNPAMHRMTGYSAEDFQNNVTECMCADPSQRERLMDTLRQSGRVRNAELEFRRKDDSIFSAVVNIDEVELQGNKVILTNIQDVSKQKFLDRELRKAQEHLETRVAERTAELSAANRKLASLNKEVLEEIKVRIQLEQKLSESRDLLILLAAELDLSEERERRRIAMALHDDVVQDLALGKLRLDMTLKDGKISPCLLKSLVNLIEKAIQQIRDICHDLSPPLLYDMGLPQAIESMGERLAREHRLGFTLQGTLEGVSLPDHVRAVLYQTVRELLINVVKHAKAKHVIVQLLHKLGMVQLSVIDDGVGFARSAGKGFGLSHVEQRIDFFNGTVRIISAPGRKTVVTVVVPITLSAEREEQGFCPGDDAKRTDVAWALENRSSSYSAAQAAAKAEIERGTGPAVQGS